MRKILLLATVAALAACGGNATKKAETPQTKRPQTETRTQTAGGYTAMRVPTAEDKAVFDEAMKGLAGVTYTPDSVATQIDADRERHELQVPLHGPDRRTRTDDLPGRSGRLQTAAPIRRTGRPDEHRPARRTARSSRRTAGKSSGRRPRHGSIHRDARADRRGQGGFRRGHERARRRNLHARQRGDADRTTNSSARAKRARIRP